MNIKYFKDPSKPRISSNQTRLSINSRKLKLALGPSRRTRSEKSSPAIHKDFHIRLRSTSNESNNSNSNQIRVSSIRASPKQIHKKLKFFSQSPEGQNIEKLSTKLRNPKTSHFSLTDPSKLPQAKREKRKQKLIQVIWSHFVKTAKEFKTISSCYKIIQQIGQGAFGKVLLAEQVLTGVSVALKVFSKSSYFSDEERRKVFKEIYILKRISSKFVVRILEYFEDDENFFIVLSYMPGGDLLQYLRETGALSEVFSKYLFKQILLATQALHRSKVIHRDIKLDNILLDSSQTSICICDFGVSKIINKHEIMNEKCGTPAYLAPEVVLDCGYEGFWSDIWSLGVVLYCMTCGTVPFKGQNLPDLHKSILTGRFEIPQQLSLELKDLISSLLKVVPGQRLSIDKALRHKWFDDCSAVQDLSLQKKMRRFREGSEGVGEQFSVVRKIMSFGFPQQYVINSVKNQALDHAYAVYSCLIEW